MRKIFATALFAVAIGGLAAADGLPSQTGADARILEPRSNWSPVALVYSHTDRQTGERRDGPVGAPGTGFLVSPCFLLTNYHVAFGEVPGRGAPGATLTVWLGEPARSYTATVEAAGDFAPATGPGEGDWALARVEGCPGRRRDIGWFSTTATALIAAGNKVTTAGFPKDRAYPRIAVHHGCAIRARFDTGAFIHDCATENGQSGSPLLLHDKGRLTVIAMVSGVVEPKDETAGPPSANYAAPLANILGQPAVATALAADLKRAGRNGYSPRPSG